jgi:hypothetical protein
MSSLFNLSNQYLELAHTLAELDFDASTIADTIEASGIVDNLATKAANIEYVARSAEANHEAIDAEIARLQALKAHRTKIAAGLREYILSNMQRMNIDKRTKLVYIFTTNEVSLLTFLSHQSYRLPVLTRKH